MDEFSLWKLWTKENKWGKAGRLLAGKRRSTNRRGGLLKRRWIRSSGWACSLSNERRATQGCRDPVVCGPAGRVGSRAPQRRGERSRDATSGTWPTGIARRSLGFRGWRGSRSTERVPRQAGCRHDRPVNMPARPGIACSRWGSRRVTSGGVPDPDCIRTSRRRRYQRRVVGAAARVKTARSAARVDDDAGGARGGGALPRRCWPPPGFPAGPPPRRSSPRAAGERSSPRSSAGRGPRPQSAPVHWRKDGEGSHFYEPLISFAPEGNFVPVLAAEVPTLQNGGRRAGRAVGHVEAQAERAAARRQAPDRGRLRVHVGVRRGSCYDGDLHGRTDKEVGPHREGGRPHVQDRLPEPNPLVPDLRRHALRHPEHVFEPFKGTKSREAPTNLKRSAPACTASSLRARRSRSGPR